MNQITPTDLSPQQQPCLGRVYQFIIERGRQNRRRAEEKQAAQDRANLEASSMSAVQQAD